MEGTGKTACLKCGEPIRPNGLSVSPSLEGETTGRVTRLGRPHHRTYGKAVHIKLGIPGKVLVVGFVMFFAALLAFLSLLFRRRMTRRQ